ncbi:MAG TPA: hypothetical protein VF477_10710 [Mycobacterium sp.]
MRVRPIAAIGIVVVGTCIGLVSAARGAEVVPSAGTAIPTTATTSDWIAKLVETLAMPRAPRSSPHP